MEVKILRVWCVLMTLEHLYIRNVFWTSGVSEFLVSHS